MKPAASGPVSFLFLLWLFAAYTVVVLFLDWTGLSHHSNILVELTAPILPSINGYAALAANQDKAAFELWLAWLFSLAVPVLVVPALNWDRVYLHTVRIGKRLRRGLHFLGTGLILLGVTLYPSPPSGSRRFGQAILAFLQADSAYLWGLALILLAGLGWLMSIAGVIQIYKTFKKPGQGH